MNTSKQIKIMVLMVFISVIAAGAYTVWDPHRAADAKTVQLQKTVDRGGYLFAQNCRACHGDSGEGGSKANRLSLSPPLNRPDLQGKKNADSPVDKAAKDAAYKLVFNTITCGRVGKAMPTWGDSQGGPLNPEQIKDLAIFVTEGTGWDFAAEEAHTLADANHIRLTQQAGSGSATIYVTNAAVLGKDTYLKIDDELLHVSAVQADQNILTVDRGQGNTKAAAHDKGATVLVEPPLLDPAKVAITQPACGQTAPIPVTSPAGTPSAPSTPAANAQQLTITASNIAFDKSTLEATAGQPITVTFDNKDNGVPHNIEFFKGADATAPKIAGTDIATGPVTQTLNLPALDAGTYFFHCVVHPATMNGTLTVTGGGGGGGATPAATSGAETPAAGTPVPSGTPAPSGNAQQLTLVGSNIQFDKTELSAKAGQPITITFDNQDGGVPHNLEVFQGADATAPKIAGTDIAAGPVKQTLDLPALQPGEYFYHCVVHPTTMSGVLKIQ